MSERIEKLIAQMTLEEKAGMCSGADFWHLKDIERLGIPRTMVTDGPHGLRKQGGDSDHLGVNASIEAVCFPTAVGAASTFDREFMTKLGETLGEECQAEDVSVLLGPAVNIKRSPLCGRNFEYFSEDPYLTGELASAYIKGVQSKNIGTSMKHYAANNQETKRMTSSSNLDERTLREIYLPGFETPVREADPWTIMTSYNRINGVYASEDEHVLKGILNDEWGFQGYSMTDWSGTNDRVLGLENGQDLQMPSDGGINDKKIVAAVNDGSLDVAVLDKAVAKILKIIFRFADNRDKTAVFDREKDHATARAMAGDTMVLLKNDGILPLDKNKKIAFIGEFAKVPRYQGSGSSFINSHKIVGALEAVQGVADVTYAQGYGTKEDKVDAALQAEAIETAKNAEIAVIFAGLPGSFESEGFDRKHMDIPTCQLVLIDEILKVQKNVVIVLHNGSPITMPWKNDVRGILESYLGGEAMGEAQVDILFGAVNPSGKLAESFPHRLADNPSFLNFPGEFNEVNYAEGIFVGYRYYDSKDMDVLFPFGFGLSYTTFEYSNLKLDKKELATEQDEITVTVDVTNTGKVAGKESVQLYVAQVNTPIVRPEKELKNFGKVYLEPGETKTVTMKLNYRSFAYYSVVAKDWDVIAGEYNILVGKSSRDIVLSAVVAASTPSKRKFFVEDNTTIGEILGNPIASQIFGPALEAIVGGFASQMGVKEGEDAGDNEMLGISGSEMGQAMMNDMPLRAMKIFGGEAAAQGIDQLIGAMNSALQNQ